MNDDEIKAGIPAIIEAARAQKGAEVVDVLGTMDAPDGFPISAVPMLITYDPDGGQRPASVLAEVKAWRDAFATKPERREGTATLDELESFIAHALRFKDDGSAIFVSGGATSPKFTSVLDYHPAGEAEKVDPRFRKHRGVFAPAFSDEWKAWTQADKKSMSQADFSAFITANVRDVLDVDAQHPDRLAEAPAWYAKRFGGGRAPGEFFASAQRLLEVAEGLTITVEDRVSDVARRDTGETKISFESKGTTDIEIPVAFVIELPVFVGGDLLQVPVRLRLILRTEGDTKRASWRIELFGATRTVLACVADMREQVKAKTGLPVFAGSPE
jgi:uncharacterized protein YfdQ (DUF2303 family)